MILHVCFVLFLVPLISTEKSLTLLNPRDGIINRLNINPRFAHRISKRSTDVSAAQQKALLDAHNEARSEVSPSATNMKIMKWDDALATSSQTWADGCSFAHSTSGENLAMKISTGSLAEDVYDISEMVKSDNANDTNWVNEKFFYTYSDTNCPSNDVCGTCQAGEQCGHYTQVVWANSEFVGCGVSYGCTSTQLGVTDPRFTNANTVYLVCQYSPSGNFIGQAPYEQGASCSNCPSTHSVCNNTLCTDSSPTSCDSAPIVENAEVTGTGVSIGDTRSYTCDSGFTLNGASEISCGADGTWSAAPTCVEDSSPTSCDSAPIVENAEVTGTGVSIGDTRSYTCDSGFTLNGASEISCGADGTWSAAPICVEDSTAVQATMACSFEADDDMCSMGVCDGFPNSVSFTDHIDADSAYPEVCHEGQNCKVIALSSIRRRNMKGCLVSDYLPDGAKCVTLAYYMHGDGYGSLDVYGRADERTFYILSVTEDLGDQWQTISVDVPPGTNERIFVRVKRFSRRNRNTMIVAVDEIEVLEGTCPCSRIPCANGGTCNANGNCQCVEGYTGSRCEQEGCGINPCVNGGTCGADFICDCVTGFAGNQCELIDSAVTCGFEADFCELIQTNDDDANWLRLSDTTPSYFTGPSEAAEGSTYAYIEASEMSVGDIATLETSDEFASGDRCIRLQLHMRGYWGHMGLFKIFAGNDGAWELAYEDAGHQGSEWYNVEVTWNLERKKVRLCAIRGYGWMSDIAIDDFEISPGAC